MAQEVMDIIKQTGKTIIFEHFNSEKDDLVTLLTRDSERIPTQKFVATINEKLTVKSFNEFVQKFSPNIYEIVKGDGNFIYTLDRPSKGAYRTIPLQDHAFYKMIMNLLDKKAISGKSNLDFPYDEVKKALTPESEMKEYKKLRKVLASNTVEYLKLSDGGKQKTTEAKRFAKNISQNLDKASSKYSGENGNALALLPLFIADRQNQIEQLEEIESHQGENNSDDTKLLGNSVYSYDNNGNLILIEAPTAEEAAEVIDYSDKANKQLALAIRKDFNTNAPATIRDNEKVADLVVNVFTASSSANALSLADKPRLEAEKKQFQDVYKNSLTSFIRTVSALVEKFAGVKSFFDHATYKGELANDVNIVIANCRVDDILDDEVAKERFKYYFNALKDEKDINRFWFGIIPAVKFGEVEDNDDEDDDFDPFDPFSRTSSSHDKNKSTKKKNSLVDITSVTEMLNILDEAKIMTFFNFKASESTGFVELSTNILKEYRKITEPIRLDHAVLCFPNFTILPKEENLVTIGTEYVDDEKRNVNISLPGIYLESSYVAAGLMCGIQNYKLLAAKNLKVNPKYPCVRFDFEEDNNNKVILTKLNRETTTEMDNEVKHDIFLDNFGFVFADNKITFEGGTIENSYVLNARTLYPSEDGKYHSIYKRLVRNMVYQLLKNTDDRLSDQVFEQWRSTYVTKWKNDNKDDERAYVNRILMSEEDINLDTKQHVPEVKFKKETEYWDEIKISEK